MVKTRWFKFNHKWAYITSGIYAIIYKDGSIYIGQAWNFFARWKRHKAHWKNNTHCNPHMQRIYNKYGGDDFEFFVLEECPLEKLTEREQYLMDYYFARYHKDKVFNGTTLGIQNEKDII